MMKLFFFFFWVINKQNIFVKENQQSYKKYRFAYYIITGRR